ncbi:MAG: glucosamine-6-phosphate deaminase [Candidatus Latescibacterota bacterium]|nr:MAG: glucosamine-6-phosphate deaminase [Candidatus Latescibacterota bacterium]
MDLDPKPVKELRVNNLTVEVHESREELGKVAAALTASLIRKLLAEKQEISMVFAAAPSQNEFLAALAEMPNVEWNRIRTFHLDEYLGLPSEAPQRFSRYLQKHIFGRVPFMEVHYIDPGRGEAPEEICARYRRLLDRYPLGIACIGIGENGHIAFNDPPVADFQDPCKVKVVRLDEACRKQQVNDGCFSTLGQVPTHAITLTIPAVMAAQAVVCVVPGERKRKAVYQALRGEISTTCPASILRTHPQARMFLDRESASLLLKEGC